MSDFAAVVLAMATAAGALAGRPVPLPLGAGLVALAFLLRRPVLLWLGCGLLASALAASSWAGLEPPPATEVAGARVMLLRDPVEVPWAGGGVRAVVRLGRRHVELTARGGSGALLQRHLAGEWLSVTGKLTPLPPELRRPLGRRHLSGRLAATEVHSAGGGGAHSRVANGLRRLLVRGAESLPREQRTLFSGFVLGDDRGQSMETVDDFRSSGLSHLLVVSGQNVAFVLALAAPGLRRLRMPWRVTAALAVLGLFGVLTRWEPSVLRAEAMAAIALGATALGRPVSTIRLLSLAVTGVLLLDPLLVGSVGFQLSVGACVGIALFARRLTEVIPGPRLVASAAAVTLAAQAGVAPVLVPVFGDLPVATLPANLMAMPAAAPVMVWGVVAGIPAGVIGGPVAAALHLPTRVLVGWVALVARTAARSPLGHIGLEAVMAIGAFAAIAAAARSSTWLRRSALAIAIAIVVAPTVTIVAQRQAPLGGQELIAGATLWRSGSTAVLVVERPKPDRLLEAVRASGTAQIDLLVMRYPGVQAARSVAPLLHRVPTRAVLSAGPVLAAPDAVVATAGTRARAGPFLVTISAADPRLQVRVMRAAAGGVPAGR